MKIEEGLVACSLCFVKTENSRPFCCQLYHYSGETRTGLPLSDILVIPPDLVNNNYAARMYVCSPFVFYVSCQGTMDENEQLC